MSVNKKNSVTHFTCKTIITAMIIATGSAYAVDNNLTIIATLKDAVLQSVKPLKINCNTFEIKVEKSGSRLLIKRQTVVECFYEKLDNNKHLTFQIKDKMKILKESDLDNIELKTINNITISISIVVLMGNLLAPYSESDSKFQLGYTEASKSKGDFLIATSFQKMYYDPTNLTAGNYTKILTLFIAEE